MRCLSIMCCILSLQSGSGFLKNFISGSPSNPKPIDRERALLKILDESGPNGAKRDATLLSNVDSIIANLEDVKHKDPPIKSIFLDGCWKLLYSSSPGSSSPIQRTFTGSNKVVVYQVINLLNTRSSFLPDSLPDISNIVCFGSLARLRITALGSTVESKLVVPRIGDGRIFGLNVLGVSSSNPPRGG
jgi:hypothetical protein